MNPIYKGLILALLLTTALFVPQTQAQSDDEDDSSWDTAGKVVVGGAALIAVAPLAIGAAGFTGAGVAAGSLAAAIQSTMGGVVASGGTFAALQSAGAAGFGMATNAVLGAVGGVAAYFY